jgi:hypothetical protein
VIGRKRSVSKLLVAPWRTAVMRSSPAPVSTEGFGRGVIFPEASLSNCMKTRFQISSNRSPAPFGTASPGTSGPWS